MKSCKGRETGLPVTKLVSLYNTQGPQALGISFENLKRTKMYFQELAQVIQEPGLKAGWMSGVGPSPREDGGLLVVGFRRPSRGKFPVGCSPFAPAHFCAK